MATKLAPTRLSLPPPDTTALADRELVVGWLGDAGDLAAGPGPDRDPARARVRRRRIAAASIALVLGALAVTAWPLLTTKLVVSILGGAAALIAFVALAAIVNLVVSDVRRDVREAIDRRTQRNIERATRRDPPASSVAPLGRHLAAYHAARRAG